MSKDNPSDFLGQCKAPGDDNRLCLVISDEGYPP